MIKVSVLYPHKGDGKFDMDYYLTKHMPLVRQMLGASLKGVSVEQGLAGGAPNSPAPFVALCQLQFDSVGVDCDGLSWSGINGRHPQLHQH